MSEIPSHPASCAARANSVMSVTFGESFAISGSFVAFRTAERAPMRLDVRSEHHAARLHVRAGNVHSSPAMPGVPSSCSVTAT